MTIMTLSLPAFYGIAWAGLAICIPAYLFRIYVRHTVFRRLLLDDYLVLVALVILAGTAATGQSTVHHIYKINSLVDTAHSNSALDPVLLSDTSLGIKAFGIALLSYLVALYTIKLSFLVFFRRLDGGITEYLVIWWMVLGLNVTFCLVSLGMFPHSCFFSSVEDALFSPKCGGTGGGRQGESRKNSLIFMAVCLLDVVSDFLVLGFPIVILCRVRTGIAVSKKMMLSAIFGLVILTIAVTVVRVVTVGAEFYREGSDANNKHGLDLSAVWILYHVELTVSILIACLVSYRALFSSQSKTASATLAAETTTGHYHENESETDTPKRSFRLHDSISYESARDLGVGPALIGWRTHMDRHNTPNPAPISTRDGAGSR